MLLRPRFARGFTMMELLIVVTIIAILAAILLPIVSSFRRSAKIAAAKQAMNAVTMALDKYREDFDSYPPDNAPSSNGSEILYWHLCRRITPKVKTPAGNVVDSESTKGPYLEAKDTIVSAGSSGDTKKLVSPLGGEYKYAQLIDSDGIKRQYLCVDPGPDKELGGDISPDKGFVPGGGDANGDGKPDDEDNIYSHAQIKK